MTKRIRCDQPTAWLALALGLSCWVPASSAATIEDVRRSYEWLDIGKCRMPTTQQVDLPEKISDTVEETTDVSRAQFDLDGSGVCVAVTTRTSLYGRPEGSRQLQMVKRYYRFENEQWREFHMDYGVGQAGERFFDYDVYAIRERKTGQRIFVVPQSFESLSMSVLDPTQLPIAFNARGWATEKNTYQFAPNNDGAAFQALAVFLTERLKPGIPLKNVLSAADLTAKGFDEMVYFGPEQGPIVGLMRKARETLSVDQLVEENKYGLPVIPVAKSKNP